MQYTRGRFDKYLASPPEGATIARQIYYRVVHSRSRRLLSKFQSNWTLSFVLIACGNGRVSEFYKYGKRAISVGDSILDFEREITQRNQRALGCCVRFGDCPPSMATVKIGLKSFNVVARRFLMNHAQVSRNRLPRRIM